MTERCIVCEGGKDGICGTCEAKGFELYPCGCVYNYMTREMELCAKHHQLDEEFEAWWEYGKQN